MLDYKKEFIQYAIDCDVLKYGEFTLKSGRCSPYFFNAGLFNSGEKLGKLGEFYAKTLINSGLEIDVLYGPAYKGITLASATAIAYARLQNDILFAFNRKESKNHGERGLIVGAPIQGQTLIVDDVITAGISVRESVTIIHNAGAKVAGVLIALDRQEKDDNNRCTVQEISRQFDIPVIAIISLNDIIEYLKSDGHHVKQLAMIQQYRLRYGI